MVNSSHFQNEHSGTHIWKISKKKIIGAVSLMPREDGFFLTTKALQGIGFLDFCDKKEHDAIIDQLLMIAVPGD